MTVLNVTADDDPYEVDRKTAEQLCQLYDKTVQDIERLHMPYRFFADYPTCERINLEPLMDWLRSFD